MEEEEVEADDDDNDNDVVVLGHLVEGIEKRTKRRGRRSRTHVYAVNSRTRYTFDCRDLEKLIPLENPRVDEPVRADMVRSLVFTFSRSWIMSIFCENSKLVGRFFLGFF